MAMSDRQPKLYGETAPSSTVATRMGPVNSESKKTPPSTEGDDRKPKLMPSEK